MSRQNPYISKNAASKVFCRNGVQKSNIYQPTQSSLFPKKITIALITLAASLTTPANAQNHIVVEFFPCDKDQPCGGGSECCEFKNPFFTTENPHFCMTDAQKAGEVEGVYYDDQNDPWYWNCYQSK